MDVIPIGELKANFSAVLGRIRRGETVVISFGKRKEKVAVLSPYAPPEHPKHRRLGLLRGKAQVRFGPDFKFKDQDLLAS